MYVCLLCYIGICRMIKTTKRQDQMHLPSRSNSLFPIPKAGNRVLIRSDPTTKQLYPIRSKMILLDPKSEKIRSDRIRSDSDWFRIGFDPIRNDRIWSDPKWSYLIRNPKKSDRIGSDRIRIGFGSDLHISSSNCHQPNRFRIIALFVLSLGLVWEPY